MQTLSISISYCNESTSRPFQKFDVSLHYIWWPFSVLPYDFTNSLASFSKKPKKKIFSSIYTDAEKNKQNFRKIYLLWTLLFLRNTSVILQKFSITSVFAIIFLSSLWLWFYASGCVYSTGCASLLHLLFTPAGSLHRCSHFTPCDLALTCPSGNQVIFLVILLLIRMNAPTRGCSLCHDSVDNKNNSTLVKFRHKNASFKFLLLNSMIRWATRVRKKWFTPFFILLTKFLNS